MSAHSPRPTEPDDPAKRRTLRRIGVGAGTVATLGAGSQVAPQLSPIGRARAVVCGGVCLTGAVGASLIAGSVAGLAVASWNQPDTPLDTNDVLENQIYEAALSVTEGRQNWIDQAQAEVIDPSNAQDTPFGRTAWQDIRAAVARTAVNGGSQTDAELAAMDALDRRATIAVLNVTERWNTALDALLEQSVMDIEESVGVFNIVGGTFSDSSAGVFGTDEPIEASSVSGGGYVYHRAALDLPKPVDAIDEYDGNGWMWVAGANSEMFVADKSSNWTSVSSQYPSQYLEATHSSSSLDAVTVLDSDFFNNVLSTIDSAYSSIQSDLSTAVENIYAGLEQGAIDPKDILGPSDIADQFADSSKQSRMAAELLAIGAEVPDGSSYHATISHPDLQADEVTGVFFPQFADGVERSLTAGMTLEPADYRMAYFGYESEVNDSFNTKMLSGDSALEIIDIEGVESRDLSGFGETLNSDGSLTLGTEDPQIADDETVVVKYTDADGNTVQETVSGSEVYQESGEYRVPLSSPAGGETVETVQTGGQVAYTQPVDYVADPTNPDDGQTQERLKNLRDQVDNLEKELEDDGGEGGNLFGGLFSSGNFGGGSFVGLAIIGAVVLAVVGFVTDMIPGQGGD